MDIVEEKGIEREPIVTELEIKEKPKRKPRSEAQKEAFEKARLVRAANLAKKKAEEEEEEEEDQGQGETGVEVEVEVPKVKPQGGTPLPKKRGRPKGTKLKREPVPEIGQFSPQNIPPQAGDIRYQYHQQPPPNWANYYQPPPQQLAPQVHNYYYGHQQGAIHSQPQKPVVDRISSREPEPEYESESSGAEEEYEEYQPPQLRYRFA
jgi:hypothetical protein